MQRSISMGGSYRCGTGSVVWQAQPDHRVRSGTTRHSGRPRIAAGDSHSVKTMYRSPGLTGRSTLFQINSGIPSTSRVRVRKHCSNCLAHSGTRENVAQA